MEALGAWSKKWQLSFNIDKFSLWSVKDYGSRLDYYLDGIRLKIGNSYSYLGIEWVYNLNWSRHIDNIVAKASG